MFDQAVFEAIYGLAHQVKWLDWLGIFFAGGLPYVLAVVFLIAVLRQAREWRHRLYDLASAALSLLVARGVLTEIIRLAVDRPRPPEVLEIAPLIAAPSSAAFPSGHASFFFALAFSIFLFQTDGWTPARKREVGLWFILGALLVGVARIFVGVHWPLDILGGIVVGFLSAYLVHLLLPTFHSRYTGTNVPNAFS